MDGPFLRMYYYVPKLVGHWSQQNSDQMKNRHPWQLKKSKSWGMFWSYLLITTANSYHIPQKWVKGAELALQFNG